MKLTIYADESGDFATGHNVICALATEVPYREFEAKAVTFFTNRGLNVAEFHAHTLARNLVEQLFLDIAEQFAEDLAQVTVGVFTAGQTLGYDFHGVMLAEVLGECLRSYNQLPTTPTGAIAVDVLRERRHSINTVVFEDAIHERVRQSCPGRNFTCHLGEGLKGLSAGVQLCDLISNVVYRRLNSDTDPTAGFPALVRFELDEKVLLSREVRQLAAELSKPSVAERVVKQYVTKQVVKEVTSIRNVTTRTTVAEEILNDLAQAMRIRPAASSTDELTVFPRVQLRLVGLSEPFRTAELEHLLIHVGQLIEDRDFALAAYVCRFLSSLVEADRPTADNKWLHIRATARWIETQNALGEYVHDHPAVQRARAFAQAFHGQTSCWSDLAYFYNFLSISHQNAYEFDQAISCITPFVNRLSDTIRNPFDSRPIYDRYIGALFGSYALSHFFAAFMEYHRNHLTVFDQYLNEGLNWSDLAKACFEPTFPI